MQEVWRPVVGWEGLYSVSDWGRVRSEDRALPHWRGGTRLQPGRILSGGSHGYPRLTVVLHGNGRRCTRKVHQLVAEAFLGPCPKGLIVLHGQGGGLDNRVGNLSYGTHKQNSADRERDGTTLRGSLVPVAKFTEADVLQIRERIAQGERQRSIAKEYGVAESTISAIKRGQNWAHLA
jgi:hypothetical protein